MRSPARRLLEPLLAALVALPLAAQQTAPAPDASAPATLTAIGTVVSSTPTELVIQVEEAGSQSFRVDARSTVPPHLARGRLVTVTYEQDAGGNRYATAVTPTEPEEGAAAPAPGATTGRAQSGPALVATVGAALALAVAVGFALRAYARTQRTRARG
jgi:hypothetical protein